MNLRSPLGCGPLLIAGAFSILSGPLGAYPLDGEPRSALRRLGYSNAVQQREISGPRLVRGALWSSSQVDIRDVFATGGMPRTELPAADAEFSGVLKQLLLDANDRDVSGYSLAVLDLSKPGQPLYGEVRADLVANVGSVGKILLAAGVLSELARLYPDDLAERERVLRETLVVADAWAAGDEHKVPFWDAQARRVQLRPFRPGDTGSLWEMLDWTLSASANSAATTLGQQMMYMNTLEPGQSFDARQKAEWFASSKGPVLRKALYAPMDRLLEEHGFSGERLRQGSLFSRAAKNHMGGRRSYASPRNLVRLLYLIEQGLLIDAFSSRELKRLLYVTRNRIRYASHPALNNAAVYFKSGSLYRCQPEPGYRCGKYKGNKTNRLSSLAMVETAPGETASNQALRYIVAVTSNVLKKNSAVAHQALAGEIHRLLAQRASND